MIITQKEKSLRCSEYNNYTAQSAMKGPDVVVNNVINVCVYVCVLCLFYFMIIVIL